MAAVIPIKQPTTREKVAALLPLVDRLHRGHCWLKAPDGGMDCIKEKLDDFKLAEHVAGRKTYGACPIAPGQSTTRAALLDFDSHKGEVDWPTMLDTAQNVAFALEQEGYTPILFRSSGGRGLHLYLLWDEPQDAYSVREMLAATLGLLGFKSGAGGVGKGQVEIFPKQNEVEPGKFGSMWVLPYAGQSEPIGEFPGWVGSPAVPTTPRPPKVARAPCDVPELARLREALDAIPNDDIDYDQWRNIGFAIHEATEGSDEGLSLFHEFSARSAKYNPDFIDNRFWPYAGRSTGDLVPAEYIISLAERNGWQDPATADDFDVVEEPVEEHEQESLPMFTPVRVADFAAGKPMDWLIKGVLPRADIGMVFGASGSGKSFLLIDMAGSIARGVDWRDRTVKKGRVCYVVAEGAAGFRKRVDAYCVQHQINIVDLDIYIIADAPNLNEKAHTKALIAGIKSAGHFDLIVLDTLAAVSAGADENSAKDMGVILERARAVGKAANAMTLIVHHAGKQADRGARGSTALKGRVDVEIEVIRADNDRAATVSKLRDQEDGASFGFKLQTVAVGMDDDGEVIDSCVVEHSVGPVAVNKAPKGAKERLVLKVARELIGLDGSAPHVTDVITEVVNQTPHDAAEGKRDRRREVALRALESLAEAGYISTEGGRVCVL